MGKTLYLECASGISGDMTVAALLDLGADEERLRAALDTLPVDGFSVAVSRVQKNGLDACDFDARLDAAHENHDHDMEYLYGHLRTGHTAHDHNHGHEHHHHDHHHAHRSLADILAIIDASGLAPRAKGMAARVFRKLAEAEAKAHGATPDTVLLHEVGAVDSIVDICAAAVCLDDLGVESVIVPALAEGGGTVRCAHGIMPVPVPAVVNLCETANIALERTAVEGELVTPTGAAIVAALRTSDVLPTRYRIVRTGLGAGKRSYEGCAGVLRAMLIEAVPHAEAPLPPSATNPAEDACGLKLETDIDDVTGEALGRVIELLMASGAREAHAVPIVMKKGRPAYQLEVICDEADAAKLELIMFENTTTIGIRRFQMRGTRLERTADHVETAYGPVAIKRVVLPSGEERTYPEYDSVVEVSERAGASFQSVHRAVIAACER